MSIENELPDGWARTTLGILGEYINGYAFNENYWSKKGRPIIRIQDLTGTGKNPNYYNGEIEDKYVVEPGDLLIAWSATLGAFIWKGPQAWLNQHIFKVNSYINKLFHYYLVQATVDNLYRDAHGSGMVHITRGKFEAITVNLPPLPEQHRIVAAIEQQFSRLDAATSSLQHVRAKLKRQRAAILKSAVEGMLTAEWRAQHPASETAEQLLQRILHERRAKWEAEQLAKKKVYKEPEPLDTRNLPELPEGWCWASFGQCFEVQVGATPSRKIAEYWGGDIPWVSSGEVQFCRIRSPREYITEAGINNSCTQINPVGSVLLGMIGEGRTRGQVAILDIEACNNQNCAAIWVSQTPVFPEFVYYWLWSQYEVTRQGSSGNNQPALNKTRVEQMIFPLVPITEQNQIVSEIEASLSIIAQTELEVEANLKRAERLRQTILAQAFAGRLVPQNPADEPASMLLERIRGEREGMQKKGKADNGRARSAIKVPDEPVKIDVQDTRQVELWESVGG